MTAAMIDFTIPTDLKTQLGKWRRRSFILGLLGLIALGFGLTVSPTQFYFSYLWSFMFVLGLTTGSLAWLMLQYTTGGAWGVVVRRPCEAAARTIPLVLVLFLPIVVGINNLYPWAHKAAHGLLPHGQQVYLTVPFFLARAAFYFAGWLFLAFHFNRWSAVEDREGSVRAHGKMTFLAGPGLVFFALSVTFAAIDWVLSLHSQWFSTMFGLLYIASQALTAMAFLIAILVALSAYRPMSEVLTPRHLHDLGKLMFALIMVWAYFSYSQFLIIWAGNLPEEITWYMARINHGWGFIALALVFGHFALPFSLLLSRDLKRNFKLVRRVAMFMLFMRLVDLFWQITPYYHGTAFSISWMDFAAPVGLIGIWLAFFFYNLEKRPLMPLHDPNLEGALEHGRD